ncbi:MAG: hypothetical protein FD167_2168 [bacterium]|nr:MAG: hypothetical protein FD167_2168 [bacterium]
MFCPGCGREILGDSNFCNICGINLQAVHQAITNAIPIQPHQNEPQVSGHWLEIEKARHNLKKQALIFMGSGMTFSIFLAIIAEFVGQFSWQAGRIIERIAPLGALFLVIGIMTLIYRRIMYGASNAKVVVLQSQSQSQGLSPEPIALPASTLSENFNPQIPPGRPLFQDMASQTARQEPIPIARQNHDPSYPYPPPTVTERTTKELKRPQTKPTTNY